MLQQFKSIHYILVFEIQMCVCVCFQTAEEWGKSGGNPLTKTAVNYKSAKKQNLFVCFFADLYVTAIRNQNICYNKFSKWMDRYFAAYAHRMHIKDGPSCL